MIERPSLHALAVYLAVVEHGTMIAAAEAEAISQPAISAHIKGLERYFRTPLMERVGRRVRPTAAGEIVADYTRRLVGLTDELNTVLADLGGVRRGPLVIGASYTASETFLPELLGRFHRAHPDIDLVVRSGNSEAVLHGVRERLYAVGVLGAIPPDPTLASHAVVTDHLLLFAAADSPYRAHAALRVADLAGETFVVREPGSAARDLALRHLAARGVAPRHIVELGSNEAVRRAVAAGLGIGVLSAHLLAPDLRAGTLAVLPCADWECHRQFWLIHRADRLLSAAEQTFLRMVVEQEDTEGFPSGGTG